jgi:hypothetical protein
MVSKGEGEGKSKRVQANQLGQRRIGRRNHSPNRGKPASRSHVERRAHPPNTGHTSLWHADNNSNLIHRGPCTMCKDYAMHVYTYVLDQDGKFLDARDRHDLNISAGEVS